VPFRGARSQTTGSAGSRCVAGADRHRDAAGSRTRALVRGGDRHALDIAIAGGSSTIAWCSARTRGRMRRFDALATCA